MSSIENSKAAGRPAGLQRSVLLGWQQHNKPRHAMLTALCTSSHSHCLPMIQLHRSKISAFLCRARAEPDGTRAETTFRLSPKRTSPFKSVGESVQSTAGSRGVRISGSNGGYTTLRGGVRVLATHSIRQFPLHFPSRASQCATTFRTQYTRGFTLTVMYSARWQVLRGTNSPGYFIFFKEGLAVGQAVSRRPFELGFNPGPVRAVVLLYRWY